MKKMNVRKIFLMLADAGLIAVSALLSNMLLGWYGIMTRGNTMGIAVQPVRIVGVIGMSMLFCFFFLFVFGAYNKVWRDLKAGDIAMCALGVVLGLGLSFLFMNLMDKPPTVEFMALDTLLSVAAICIFRVSFRNTVVHLIQAGEFNSEEYDRTLVVGAGNAARMILQEIKYARQDQNNPSNMILPVCMVDDDPSKFHTKLMGVEVVGLTKDIPLVCRQYNIDLVIFAIPSCTEEERKRIMGYCADSGCRIKTVP